MNCRGAIGCRLLYLEERRIRTGSKESSACRAHILCNPLNYNPRLGRVRLMSNRPRQHCRGEEHTPRSRSAWKRNHAFIDGVRHDNVSELRITAKLSFRETHKRNCRHRQATERRTLSGGSRVGQTQQRAAGHLLVGPDTWHPSQAHIWARQCNSRGNKMAVEHRAPRWWSRTDSEGLLGPGNHPV